jgi:hypothetical protein
MSCSQQTWVGAYVLDALEPHEAAEVQRHIAGCQVCQDEVVSLSWLPALLSTVRLEDVERLDDAAVEHAHRSAPVLDRLLAAARSTPRTRQLRRPLAAALALVAAAPLAGAAAVGSGQFAAPSGPQPVAIRTIDARSQVHAAVTLSARSWGTEVQLRLSRVSPGEHCSLVARSWDGRSDVAATWVASYHGTADVPGTTAIPLDQLREVDVVTAEGRQLARLVVPPGNR